MARPFVKSGKGICLSSSNTVNTPVSSNSLLHHCSLLGRIWPFFKLLWTNVNIILRIAQDVVNRQIMDRNGAKNMMGYYVRVVNNQGGNVMIRDLLCVALHHAVVSVIDTKKCEKAQTLHLHTL